MECKQQILGITRQFSDDDWSDFIRSKLNLEEEDIAAIEDSSARPAEKKYRAVRKWMVNKDETSALEELKHLHTQYMQEAVFRKAVMRRRMSSLSSPEKRGCALIISNGFDNGNLENRSEASNNDLIKMEDLWKDKLKCTLFGDKVHGNVKANEMRKLLINFAKIKKTYDYFVVYISTHGGKVAKHSNWRDWLKPWAVRAESIGFYGEDGKAVSEDELMGYFRNDECCQFGVTKFFILDYCRGSGDKTSEKSIAFSGEEVVRPPVPLQSDIITLYATHRDQTASEVSTGSHLTDALYAVLKDNWQYHSLTSMLTMVNKEMKERVGRMKIEKSMSIFESSLVTDFSFVEPRNPGLQTHINSNRHSTVEEEN